MLLKADVEGPGWTDAKIADAFNARTRTVEKLRERLVGQGFEIALNGKKRENPPTPAKLDGEGEAKLIAMRLVHDGGNSSVAQRFCFVLHAGRVPAGYR